MSAIINSIIRRQQHKASVHVEQCASITAGHRADEPGLRGHSVGDTFPYGVTGYGDRWAVTKHGAPLIAKVAHHSSPTKPAIYPCKLAHELARLLSERDALGLGNTDLVRAVSWDEFEECVKRGES